MTDPDQQLSHEPTVAAPGEPAETPPLQPTAAGTVILRRGRATAVRAGHPWVMSGAVDRVDGAPRGGDLVRVTESSGAPVGTGFYNPTSQVRVRLLEGAPERCDGAFLAQRLDTALQFRRRFLPADRDAFRWFYSESDGISGLIVDRYPGCVVMQCLSAGVASRRAMVAEAVRTVLPDVPVLERSESINSREGTPSQRAWAGECGVHPFRENGLTFLCDPEQGQKTGWFIDQAENRALVGSYAADRRVLDAFCYTGGFGIHALAGGAAQVVCIETSEPALHRVSEHAARNDLNAQRLHCERTDVFEYLRHAEEPFDLIVLDPPAFAAHRQALPGALRGYNHINRLALQRLRPGGLLFTMSRSPYVTMEQFQLILARAARDAGRRARIIRQTGHPFDHPIHPAIWETAYLKGILLHVE